MWISGKKSLYYINNMYYIYSESSIKVVKVVYMWCVSSIYSISIFARISNTIER